MGAPVFRLWLCENFILQVFQRELKMPFQILFESLSGINYLVKQFGLPEATEQLSVFKLWLCENFILQVSQREIRMSFETLFKLLITSTVSCCLSALSNIASISLKFEFNSIQIKQGL